MAPSGNWIEMIRDSIAVRAWKGYDGQTADGIPRAAAMLPAFPVC